MRIVLILVVGLYGWSFAGSWFTRAFGSVEATLEDASTLSRALQEAQVQEQRDYIAFLEGLKTASELQDDETRVRRYRDRLVVVLASR